MKLIKEHVEEIQYLTEGTGPEKKLFIKGIFAQGEVINKNNRRYPISILEKEMKRFTDEDVRNSTAVGELGHPSGPNVNLDRACILIKEIKQDGKNFYGTAQVLSTPMGKVVENLINDGCKLGVSTRALGSVKQMDEGFNEVQDDLRLLAVDVVSSPSAPDAYVNGIFEGAEWIYDSINNSYIETKIKSIKSMSSSEIQRNKVRLFEAFVNSLKNKPL